MRRVRSGGVDEKEVRSENNVDCCDGLSKSLNANWYIYINTTSKYVINQVLKDLT